MFLQIYLSLREEKTSNEIQAAVQKINEWIHWVENVAHIKMNQIQIDQHSDISIGIYIRWKKDNFSVIYTLNLKKNQNNKTRRKIVTTSVLVLWSSDLPFFYLYLTVFLKKIRETRNPQSFVKDLMKITGV